MASKEVADLTHNGGLSDADEIHFVQGVVRDGLGNVTNHGNSRRGTVGELTAHVLADVPPSSGGDMLGAHNLSELTSPSTARTNLGLGSAATFPSSSFLQTANNLSDLGNVATARTNLSVYSKAEVDAGRYDPTAVKGSFANWATAKARGAVNPARMLFVGDSNVAGEGSGTSGAQLLIGAAAVSFARKFANLLGYQTASFLGDQNITLNAVGVTTNQYDPRITLGTGWATDTGTSAIAGGKMFTAAGGAGTDRLTFAPGTSFNKFRLWWPRTAGVTTTSPVVVDGTTVATLDETGVGSVQKTDFAVAAGIHTIAVGKGSASTYVSGIECFDGSATPVFLTAGYRGALAANHVDGGNPWNSLFGIPALAPDYCLYYCTINDIESGTAQATYYANVETFIKGLKAVNCDGCLMVGFPSSGAGTTNALLEQYCSILRGIAADYGWSFFDSRRVFGHSYVNAQRLALNYDTKHPNATGGTSLSANLYAFLSPNL